MYENFVQLKSDLFIIYYYNMEKLIELLNEYLWQSGIVAIDQEIEWGRDIFFENEDWFHAEEAEIISKKFWFIQWLVDNDKIDIQWAKNLLYESEVFNSQPYTDLAERLIMYLAIQDDPISFLSSILK